jgi:diguanylate cyclase (GGDEF)-like protein/PAS domain S-box-containing protein
MKAWWKKSVAHLQPNQQRMVVRLMGALLVCVWGFVGFWSWWERTSILHSNTLVLEQLTAAVHAQTHSLFKQAEALLIVGRQWMAEHPDQDPGTAPEFVALVEQLRTASDGLLDVRMVSRSGELRFIPDFGEAHNTIVSDRDYFRAQHNTPTWGLYVGEPVLGRISKKWVLPISAPIERAGADVSVLLITIELNRIAAAFEAERTQLNGALGIVRQDGTLLFRSPFDSKTIGKSIAQGEAWSQYMRTQARGTYASRAGLFDQRARLTAFSSLKDFPLVVYVSASQDDLLRPWRWHTAILAGVAALVSLVTLAMGGALMRALTASQRSDAIVRSTEDAILGTTLEGTVTSWNPGAERMFGYSAADMQGQSILRLQPPDRMAEESDILDKIKSGISLEHLETIRVCKDGGAIHVAMAISPIRDSFGHLVGASKIIRNTTEQKNAIQQLRLTASVFTNTSEGILITDPRGRIVEVNGAFSRITGYNRDEVVGKDARMLRSSLQGPEVFRAIRSALRQHGEWKGELQSCRKDGAAYAIWLTVSTVSEGAGQVRNYVGLFSDITVLKLQQKELEHGAHFDALTDLPNRLLLSDRLHQAMTHCQRHNQHLAVLYLDLDGFKSVNDQFGHEAGDALLVAVSRRMQAALREVDTLARMGGDEFVAVLTGVESTQDCIQLVERLLNTCAEPVSIQGRNLHVTASIGVTMYPQDNAEAEQLMRHADQAMYEAKQSGKNRFHLFDSAQDAEAKSRSLQQEAITLGMAGREFVLYYQPKVNMRTGAIVGTEALIRWQHPAKGLLAPGTFLPAIEKHPLSEVLGSWVIDTALQQMDTWKRQGLTLPVSVNIAARQLQHPGFARHLAELLSHYPGVDAHCLELEVLETSALEDINATATIMQECHRLGVRFALDDFGTGYSSLTYLRHLPVETLKIDQSFVRDMLADHSDLSIVVGVIGLATAFQRDVIAEGVETLAHGTRLLALGCPLAQGYAIARPMPASQIPGWCATWKPAQEWTQCHSL